MQTFLPYPDFSLCAKTLDNKRLGKQRVEAFQILCAISNPSYGWQSHPAVNMWRSSEHFLILYGITICQEWRHRGFKDTMLPRFYKFYFSESLVPSWLGDKRLHASHRSNLLRKLPTYYSQFKWHEPPTLEYFWPIKKEH